MNSVAFEVIRNDVMNTMASEAGQLRAPGAFERGKRSSHWSSNEVDRHLQSCLHCHRETHFRRTMHDLGAGA